MDLKKSLQGNPDFRFVSVACPNSEVGELRERTAAFLAERRAELAVMQIRTSGIRCLGSTALDMAYVAMGRLDGAWHHNLKAWDMAAGVLLIREAGGFVHGINGEASPLFAGGYVAGNADLLPQIKSGLEEAKKVAV